MSAVEAKLAAVRDRLLHRSAVTDVVRMLLVVIALIPSPLVLFPLQLAVVVWTCCELDDVDVDVDATFSFVIVVLVIALRAEDLNCFAKCVCGAR